MAFLRLSVAASVLFIVAFAGACGSDDDAPVSATPGGLQVRANQSALHQARLDAAKQLTTDALKVELNELRYAGWDGCLGVQNAGQPCAALFVGGYIAIFTSGDRQFRYHIAGNRVVGPVDPAKASDGSPVPPELRTDLAAVLATYARYDRALRLKADVSKVAIETIAPIAAPEGAFVGLSANGAAYWVKASSQGGLTDLSAQPPGLPLIDLQRAMRQDLARRLNVDLQSISIIGYEQVTWPDSCLGIQRPGTVCAQVLVPGFLALLADHTGAGYRYHGAADAFTAASFESGAHLSEPIRGR